VGCGNIDVILRREGKKSFGLSGQVEVQKPRFTVSLSGSRAGFLDALRHVGMSAANDSDCPFPKALHAQLHRRREHA
jgi:hypothetical protein